MWLIGALALFVVIFSCLKPPEREATITAVGEPSKLIWEKPSTNNAVKITTNRTMVDVVAVSPTNNVPKGYKRIKLTLVGEGFATKTTNQPQTQIKTNQ